MAPNMIPSMGGNDPQHRGNMTPNIGEHDAQHKGKGKMTPNIGQPLKRPTSRNCCMEEVSVPTRFTVAHREVSSAGGLQA